ncbi:hypothetical protein [Sphingomonas endophytica]|uniref:Uncharacterized protein n=1 Tax=Sphingomonas endophytica TaxID=869719 RepID=A0A147I0G4_9SPHN|nr:hypothetical protein [Sphingomonas endophytica]KTT70874.1 hypothetical protein NS334_11640 [Sphingomonas endophytica]
MNKMLIGVVAFSSLVAATGASAAPWVVEEAHVPLSNGVAAIAMVKNGDAERTVVCRDTADALVKLRPEGIAFDTSMKHGKKVTTEEVVDDAQIIPVGVDACTIAKGDHFSTAVAKARGI